VLVKGIRYLYRIYTEYYNRLSTILPELGRRSQQILIIAAAPQRVWDTIRNFHDASWTPNVIASLEIVGDKGGDEIGAGRVLNGVLHETLRELDDAGHTFAYSIDDM
jgi:hypothetical protein